METAFTCRTVPTGLAFTQPGRVFFNATVTTELLQLQCYSWQYSAMLPGEQCQTRGILITLRYSCDQCVLVYTYTLLYTALICILTLSYTFDISIFDICTFDICTFQSWHLTFVSHLHYCSRPKCISLTTATFTTNREWTVCLTNLPVTSFNIMFSQLNDNWLNI